MILGRLHHEAPYIPLLLTWPDLETSEDSLRRAVEIAPANRLAKAFLADTLHSRDKEEEARKVLEEAKKMPPDPARIVEDERALAEIREIEASW